MDYVERYRRAQVRLDAARKAAGSDQTELIAAEREMVEASRPMVAAWMPREATVPPRQPEPSLPMPPYPYQK